MSPSENNPSPKNDSAPAPTPEPTSTPEPVPAPETAYAPVSEAADAPAPTKTKPPKSPKNPRKKLSKKAKIALLAVGWVALLGIAAGVAFLLKPAPEIVYTDAITAAYKFSAQGAGEILDLVDDLDYYGTYVANPLTFTQVEEGTLNGIYLISGLKNKSVEDKINNRIKEAADTVCSKLAQCIDDMRMVITANYFNILSAYIFQYDYYSDNTISRQYEYLTFDLNTGDELSFDDLFPKNANIPSLLFKSFYDGLSTKIQFAKLDASKRLASAAYFPDPASCQAQYCPYAGETYDSISALIADYDEQLANMEQIAAKAVQDYLSGERKFYLNSYGPAFVLSDGTTIEMELQDNIRYAVYLKNYRSSGSIFENAASTLSTPFFTEISNQNINYIKEETDTYLFDYLEYDYPEDNIPSETRQALREYVKNQALSVPGEAGKFRYISASVLTGTGSNIRQGYITACVYDTDKSYYDSVFKKAIVDGKNQLIMFGSSQQPPRIGRYDEDRVTKLTIDGANYCYNQFNVVITDSGDVLTSVDDILTNPSGSERGWKDYIDSVAYAGSCNQPQEKCFTEEERQTNELTYSFNGISIVVYLKDDNSESGSTYFYSVDLKSIPRQYINPAILVE